MPDGVVFVFVNVQYFDGMQLFGRVADGASVEPGDTVEGGGGTFVAAFLYQPARRFLN